MVDTYGSVEEVGMTGNLTQLHDHVHEPRLTLLLPSQSVHSVDILLQDRTVPLALHIGQADVNIDLLLCWPPRTSQNYPKERRGR